MTDRMTASRTISLPMKAWAVIAERAEINRITMSKALTEIVFAWNKSRDESRKDVEI